MKRSALGKTHLSLVVTISHNEREEVISIKLSLSTLSRPTASHISLQILCLCLSLYISQHSQSAILKFTTDFHLGLWFPTTEIVFTLHMVFEIKRERLRSHCLHPWSKLGWRNFSSLLLKLSLKFHMEQHCIFPGIQPVVLMLWLCL